VESLGPRALPGVAAGFWEEEGESPFSVHGSARSGGPHDRALLMIWSPEPGLRGSRASQGGVCLSNEHWRENLAAGGAAGLHVARVPHSVVNLAICGGSRLQQL